MKYMIAFSEKQHGSALEYENAQARFWRSSANSSFQTT